MDNKNIEDNLYPFTTDETVSVDFSGISLPLTFGKHSLFLAQSHLPENSKRTYNIAWDSYILYCHLIYTGIIQSTNSVWANDYYLQNGLNIGAERIAAAKRLLKKLGLIEISKQKPLKNNRGKFSKTFIKVITHTPLSMLNDDTDRTPFDHSTVKPLAVPAVDGSIGVLNALGSNINSLSNNLNNLGKVEHFPGNSFKVNLTGKEKEEEKDMEKFPLTKNKSFYEEKLYKEYFPVIKEFENFGFSTKFNTGSKTPEYLYNHFHALAAGEFKGKLKAEQQTKLKDYKKLDTPQPPERLAKYIKKALTTFQKIKTDADYWPHDKSKIMKLSISDFILSQKRFSWLMYCLSEPEPAERQDYQLSAIKKKFDKLKISESNIMSKLYNNHSDAHRFTEKQWTEVYFSLHSIFNYIDEFEKELGQAGAYETPRTFLELMGTWNLSQSKMITNFKVGSMPWQWFNEWLKKELGFNMIVKKKAEISPAQKVRDRENEAIEFFGNSYNELFRGKMKGQGADAIETEARRLAVAAFPDVKASVFKIERAY